MSFCGHPLRSIYLCLRHSVIAVLDKFRLFGFPIFRNSLCLWEGFRGLLPRLLLCDKIVSLLCNSGLKGREGVKRVTFLVARLRTRRASRSDVSGTDACTGGFDFSSCRASSRALFSFRNRSSSSVSGAEVDSAAAGAADLRASRSSEIAADSFWAASRADFSWVFSAPRVLIRCRKI